MRQRHIVGTLGVIGLSMLLAGCTGTTSVDPLPSVTAEVLTVPDSMSQKQPYVTMSGTALSATDTLPFAFGGSVIEPGKPSVPAVWLSEDGKDWRRTIVADGFTGSFSGQLAGSDKLAALGGTEWKDRALTSKLWVSKDRELWNPIDLPDDFAGRFRIVTMTVVDKRITIIGQAADGAVSGLTVLGSKVSPLTLPKPAKDELLYPSDLVGNSDGLVLLAQPGPEGDPVPTVAFRSSDNGKTWSSPSEIATLTSNISGIVWTGQQFLATGYAPASDAPGASSRASAWSSVDGDEWKVETVPNPPDGNPFFLVDNADVWLGAPLVTDGRTTVIAGNENSAVSALYERSPDGVWSFGGNTTSNQASGGGGVAIPAKGGGAAALLGSSGYLRTGWFSGAQYAEGTTIASREFLDRVSDFYPGRDSELIALSRSTYTVTEDFEWRNSSQSSLAEYTGGSAVKATKWSPDLLNSLLDNTMAVDDSGAEVVIGSEFPEGGDAIVTRGYFRAAGETEWQELTGFASTGATDFSKIIHAGSEWVAVGGYRTATVAGTPSHGTVWTSSDGVTWAQAAGDFGEGRLRTSTSDVCTLPNGKPIAIGWVEQSSSSYRMAAWSPSGETWSRVDLGASAEREGYASSCASDKNGVVISATIGGRSVLLHTKDGTSWKKVFTADRSQEVNSPVAVPGGFAASGSWSNDTTTGAVVWLSRDGISWTPVAVPSQNAGTSGHLAPYGKDLLISMSATSGNPLLVIRDVKKAINDLVPKS